MFSFVLTLLGTLSLAALIALVCGATVTDLRWHRVPNWATYTGFLVAVAISALVSILIDGEAAVECDFGLIGFRESLSGAAACFGLVLLPYALCRTGAGDVKLACAIGAFLGVHRGLSVVLWCYVLAAAVGIVWIVWKLGPLRSVGMALRVLARLICPFFVSPPEPEIAGVLQTKMPMGGFFALGTVFTLLGGTLL